MLGYLDVGRVAGAYSAQHLDDARAIFMFRTERPLDYHHHDVPRQKHLLREAFAGMGGEIPRWLDELDHTSAFYFDSITQLHMDTWSRGRVTLVGDAAHCPGPVVGGSTSLAVVGAYVLAGELAQAGGDHERAYPAYEREIGDYVRGSRAFARNAALIPRRPAHAWALIQGARLLSHTPAGPARALAKLNTRSVRLHDSVTLKEYRPTTCRRAACSRPAIGRGLCAVHYGQWITQQEPLMLPDDRHAPPAPQTWLPPPR